MAKQTRSLAAPNVPANAEMPPELIARVASLAAVALTLVFNDTDPSVTDDRTVLYRGLHKDVSHLLPAAEDDLVTTYFEGLVSPDALDLWLYDAREMAQDAAEGDPLGEIERDLEIEPTTIRVTRPGLRLLHLTADVPQERPARLALELIGRAEDHPGVGVWVSNKAGDWALVVWRRPDLIRVTSRPCGSQHWRHQVLRGLVGPQSLAMQELHGANPAQYDQKPKGQRTEAAAAVLSTMGITDPVPPALDITPRA